jgi:hypothetical protein
MSIINFTTVNSRLGFYGKDVFFCNEELYGLKVGTDVISIGCGKENGTIRTDYFSLPVKYMGSLMCNFTNNSEKMFAFKSPIKHKEFDIYYLYGDTGHELFTEAIYSKVRNLSFVRFYKPVFKKPCQ